MRSQGGVRMNAAKSFSRARKDEEQEMGVLFSATILALCCNRRLQRFVHDLNQVVGGYSIARDFLRKRRWKFNYCAEALSIAAELCGTWSRWCGDGKIVWWAVWIKQYLLQSYSRSLCVFKRVDICIDVRDYVSYVVVVYNNDIWHLIVVCNIDLIFVLLILGQVSKTLLVLQLLYHQPAASLVCQKVAVS